MDEREYIIENITKEEWEILEDNAIKNRWLLQSE